MLAGRVGLECGVWLQSEGQDEEMATGLLELFGIGPMVWQMLSRRARARPALTPQPKGA